jgi:exosortase/archaeosortase family protein
MRPRPVGRGLMHTSRAWIPWIKLNWTRYRRVILPGAIFLVLVGFFFFLYNSVLLTSRPFHGFMAFTADISGWLLNLTGRGVEVSDTVVASSQFAFQIVDLCTAVMPMLIFTAAIIAFPSRLKEKLLGLIVGLLGIFVINQVRLVSLFFIGIYAPGIFETAHLLVWQSLMILLAIGLWLIWAYKYVRTSAV